MCEGGANYLLALSSEDTRLLMLGLSGAREKAAEASLERKHKREMEAAVMKKWKPHRHTVRKKHVGTC